MIPQVIWLAARSSPAIRGRAAMNRATPGGAAAPKAGGCFQPLDSSSRTRAICMPATPGRRAERATFASVSWPKLFAASPRWRVTGWCTRLLGDLMTSEIHALAIEASPPAGLTSERLKERSFFSQSRRIILNCRPRAHRPSGQSRPYCVKDPNESIFPLIAVSPSPPSPRWPRATRHSRQPVRSRRQRPPRSPPSTDPPSRAPNTTCSSRICCRASSRS